MTSGLFITGTDTGVGKTHVACGLASALRRQGANVGVMKPAETGCFPRAGSLYPRDAVRLMRAAAVRDALDLVNPYRFSAPLAPSAAAAHEGKRIRVERIRKAFRALVRRHDWMLVEGAGGIMVPLTGRTTYLDLAGELRLPALIVARPGLGTINHTLLTVMALRAYRLPIAGIVINYARKGRPGLAERTSPAVIESLSRLPIIGTVRYGQEDMGNIAARLAADEP